MSLDSFPRIEIALTKLHRVDKYSAAIIRNELKIAQQNATRLKQLESILLKIQANVTQASGL